LKRKGAEAVYQKVATLSIEQQLEYWRKGSVSLRQQMKAVILKDEPHLSPS